MRPVQLALRLLAVVVVGLAWTAGTSGAQGQVSRIVDFAFEPLEQTVPAGTTITWQNTGNRPHTVTDRGGTFDTGAILPGATGDITLTAPGTYFLFCEINPSRMNATITVTPGPATPTEVRVQAVDEARDGAVKQFDPAELEVAAGTRVTLANVGGLPHSLVAEDGSFKTDIVQPGAEQGRFHGGFASVVVDEPGTYPFFCEIHPAAMKGVLTVTDEEVEAADAQDVEEDPPPPQAAVDTIDFAFDLTSTEVAPGGAVTWSNKGAKPHTATFDDVQLDTGRIEPGASAELVAPTQPGTYSYFCNIHPAQMRGVLIVAPVEAAAADDGGGDAGGDDEDAAPPAVDEESDGSVVAYVIAALALGAGAAGLYFGLRKRPTA